MNRRAILCGSLGALAMGRGGATRATAPRMAVPLGLQLFSLDAEMEKDLPGTLREVQALGYREVELVGYYGLEAADLRGQLRAAALGCRSIHIRPMGSSGGIPGLAADPERHFSRCRELKVHYLVCPGPWFPESIAATLPSSNLTIDDIVAAVNRMNEEDWRRSAELISDCALQARAHGLQLLYHNGNLEFVQSGTRTGFDLLLRHFDPEVKLELDCGWIMAAGRDPVQYLRDHAGRISLVHIKDMAATPANTRMTLNPAQIGEGIVDWPRLLQAIRAAGVERAYIEQEAPFARPAMEYARNDLRFLEKIQ